MVPDSNNVLVRLTMKGNSYWLPRWYRHASGILVWKLTNDKYAVYRVGKGWTFHTPLSWSQTFLTPVPEFLAITEMVILGHIVLKTRHPNVAADSLNRVTVVAALNDAIEAHHQHLELLS